jgi:hypothetical protein
MTDIEVAPVRRKGRYSLDRGVVVLVAMAVVIGIALLKPWSVAPAISPGPAVAGNEAAPTRTALRSTDPTAPVPRVPGHSLQAHAPSTTAWPIDTQSPISLVEARRRAMDGTRYPVRSALLATSSDTQRVRFRDSVPSVTEFGYCDSGALFESPVHRLALITSSMPVTGHDLVRVFESGAPVSIPVGSLETAPDGFVLVANDGKGLAVGHYAVIMRAYGAVEIVPFCVAEVVRLANGAVARLVPQDASNAASRKALLRDLANIRSE